MRHDRDKTISILGLVSYHLRLFTARSIRVPRLLRCEHLTRPLLCIRVPCLSLLGGSGHSQKAVAKAAGQPPPLMLPIPVVSVLPMPVLSV